jgi:Uma2 family endonuclease
MTPAERRATVDALPGYIPEGESCMSEGDPHFDPKSEGRETLRTYFERAGRKLYVSSELPVYYPNETRFAPDLLAVREVETHARKKWVVSAEGHGLDWVLEILVGGDRRKDLEANVLRYARLLIPEYFVFDRERNVLRGWRLPDPKIGIYQPIVPQRGALRSSVLELDLKIEGDRLRFRQGIALVPSPGELILHLEHEVNDLVVTREHEAFLRVEAEQQAERERVRAESAEQRAASAEQRVAREQQRADEATRRLEEALRELERLRAGGTDRTSG